MSSGLDDDELRQGLIDPTRLGIGIDVGSGQRGGFREAHACGDQPGCQFLSAFAFDVIAEQPELWWCEEHRLVDARTRQSSALARVGCHHPGAYPGIERPRQEAMFARDGLATPAELLHLPRDRGLGDRRDRHRPEHRIDVAGDVSPLVACFDRMGGRFALRRALTN